MNDDYLWDKTGQPDPEIQQLEEILGTLRFQPRPLALPQDLRVPRRHRYVPLLAIAATLLLALLAAGIWMRVRPAGDSQHRAEVPKATPATEPKETLATNGKHNEAGAPGDKPTPREDRINRRRTRTTAPVLAKKEREEALAVKEQLMLALRLASEKLNLAHRKTQGPTPANQIKNQHRIG